MSIGTIDRTPPPFFRQGLSALTKLVLCSVMALGLMVADNRFEVARQLRAGIATVLYYPQQVLLVPVAAWGHSARYLSGLQNALSSAAAAQRQLLSQTERALQTEQLQIENAKLRELLALSPRLAVRSQAAQVLYDASDPYSRKFVIDRGATNGVVLGSPVVNEAGVLGQVTRVFPLSSEVTLLSDKDAAISVLNARSQARSVAFGSDAGVAEVMEMRFMAGNSDVQVNDALVTSGMDGVFPAGLPVAKVLTIDRKVDTGFARIVLAPAAVADAVKQVMVLAPVGLQMPAPPPAEAASTPQSARAPGRKLLR
jgi:rod shape-determining protein MreC